MGGLGTSSQTQTQRSATNPWLPAQPTLGGILTQLNNYLPQTGINPTQTNALNTIENNSNAAAANWTPSVYGYAQSLLNGGGANAQAGNVQNAFNQYQAQTNPLASNTDYNPYNTPGFSDALKTANNDITNQINGSFAAAGRDFSGANQQALARGLAQGDAQMIANQYNQNVQNQQGAASNLYGASNTNAGILSGLQQQFLANQGQGVNAIGQGLDLSNVGANATLAAEAQRLGIPLQNLGMLANIGIPIAGLGSQSAGTSTTTSTMSPIGAITGLLGAFNSFKGGR